MFNLIRRKNSKETILNGLFELIKSNYSIKILKIIFNKIVRRLYKTIYDQKNLSNDSNQLLSGDILLMANKNNSSQPNSCDLINPKVSFIIIKIYLARKLVVIKQADIYYYLFRNLESNPVK